MGYIRDNQFYMDSFDRDSTICAYATADTKEDYRLASMNNVSVNTKSYVDELREKIEQIDATLRDLLNKQQQVVSKKEDNYQYLTLNMKWESL